MSQVVDELPPRAFKRKYPWEQWADGRIHWLRRGEDFQVSIKSFVHAAYTHAERYELTLTTRVRGDDVWLVFRSYAERRVS